MKYKDWSNFLVSCSSISSLMSRPVGLTDLTKPQIEKYKKLLSKEEPLTPSEQETLEILSKKKDRYDDPELSKAAKNYMLTRFSWEKYNKGTLSINEKSSCVIKGNELEDDAIKAVSVRDKIKYSRTSDTASNEYIFGCCDIFSPENNKIIDVKVSWGIHSFLPNHITKLSSKYWYQMQGYLELYNLEQGEVCYVLLNTPSYLLEREKAKLIEKYMLGEIEQEKYEDDMERCELHYDYSKIPKRRKIISFTVKRDREAMKKVYKKVERCRQWMLEFEEIHSKNKKVLTLREDYGITSKANSIECYPDECVEDNAGG